MGNHMQNYNQIMVITRVLREVDAIACPISVKSTTTLALFNIRKFDKYGTTSPSRLSLIQCWQLRVKYCGFGNLNEFCPNSVGLN